MAKPLTQASVRSAQQAALRVRGYTELAQALRAMPREIQKDVRDALRSSGERVRRLSAIHTGGELDSAKSARGYRTIVRARGIDVEQSLRKTTGLRADWGVTQMRKSLIPSLLDSEPFILQDFEHAVQEVNDYFELRARWAAKGFIQA